MDTSSSIGATTIKGLWISIAFGLLEEEAFQVALERNQIVRWDGGVGEQLTDDGVCFKLYSEGLY